MTRSFNHRAWILDFDRNWIFKGERNHHLQYWHHIQNFDYLYDNILFRIGTRILTPRILRNVVLSHSNFAFRL